MDSIPRAASEAEPSTRLLAEQVGGMAAAGVVGAASGLFGALVIAAALLGVEHARPFQVAVWIALQAPAYAAHAAVCLAWRARPIAAPPPTWAWGFTLVAATEGTIWGAAIVWFCATGPLEQELLVVLIAGGIAGALGLSFGSYLPAFLARFLPATLPYVAWAVAFAPPHHAIHTVLAVSVTAFIASNIQLARGFNASFLAVHRARLDNTDLAAALRVQKDAAEAATLAKSKFLAAASHDLRQPVHALSLLAAALQGSDLPTQARRLLGHIATSVAALDALFAALLDISRLDAGAVPIHASTFAVGPLLARIAADHAPQAARRGLTLRAVRTTALAATDAVLLERILRNLVANAVRYTDQGGIVIGCRSGRRLGIEVWDTGRGIPATELSRVFDEFHQLHRPGAERGPGLGLGLAIARRLSNLLGLDLTVRSVPASGSCFRLSLPRGTRADLPETPPTKDPGPHTIMVLDNDPAILQAMAVLFESWGHTVHTAATPADAVTAPLPHLIISDVHLDGAENGIQAVAALRARHGKLIPALLITADTTPDILRAARAANLPLLHKPVANRRLSAAIAQALSG